MIKVEFRGKHGEFAYQTSLSAAADLCAQEAKEPHRCWRAGHTPARWVIEHGDWCCIPTGLFITSGEVEYMDVINPLLPSAIKKRIIMVPYLEITPRSGLAIRHALSSPNSPSVIDADYRGEIGAILQNLGRESIVIHPGDRIAQIKGCHCFRIEGVEVKEVERGTGGFGSTNAK